MAAKRKEGDMSKSINEMKEELTEWKVRLNHDEADMIRFQHRFAAAFTCDEVMTNAEFENFSDERKYLDSCISFDRAKIKGIKAAMEFAKKR